MITHRVAHNLKFHFAPRGKEIAFDVFYKSVKHKERGLKSSVIYTHLPVADVRKSFVSVLSDEKKKKKIRYKQTLDLKSH